MAEVRHHHHVVARATLRQAVEGDHLVCPVDPMDDDDVAEKTTGDVDPVAAQPDQIPIEPVDAAEGLAPVPIIGTVSGTSGPPGTPAPGTSSGCPER